MSAVCLLLHPMHRVTGFPRSCKHTHRVRFQHSQADYLFVDIERATRLIRITSLFSCIHSWSTSKLPQYTDITASCKSMPDLAQIVISRHMNTFVWKHWVSGWASDTSFKPHRLHRYIKSN